MISDSPTTINPDAQLDRRLGERVEDVRARRDEQRHVSAVPLCDGHDTREQLLLVVREHLVFGEARRAVPLAEHAARSATTTSRPSASGWPSTQSTCVSVL